MKERFDGSGRGALADAIKRHELVGGDQTIADAVLAAGELVEFAKGAAIITEGAEDKHIIPPDKDVMRQLIALADEDFAVKLTFAAATGVRAGELHALRWKHISFSRREVKIETRVDPYGDEDVPKTIAGVRSIPLGENVVLSLKAWRLRSPHTGQDDLVFPNSLGAT
jgi:integrase